MRDVLVFISVLLLLLLLKKFLPKQSLSDSIPPPLRKFIATDNRTLSKHAPRLGIEKKPVGKILMVLKIKVFL